jgi:hypothetical protein
MRDWPALPEEGFSALYETLERGARSPGGSGAQVLRTLRRVEAHLRRPLRIAVMGEQNSGKSSLINMLLRTSAVPSGALSGVRAHLLLRHGAEMAVLAVGADGARARLTSKALAKLAIPEIKRAAASTPVIYDASDEKPAHRRKALPGVARLQEAMPGASESSARLIEVILPHSFLQRAELVESRLYPRGGERMLLQRAFRPVDLTIWCTLATQAWKETERLAWQRLPAHCVRNAMLLVTYKDALANAKEEARLVSRLKREAGPFFRDIALISPRRAMEALGAGDIVDAARWERSGAAVFETALSSALLDLHRRRFARSAGLLRKLAAALANGSGDMIGSQFAALIGALETCAATPTEG